MIEFIVGVVIGIILAILFRLRTYGTLKVYVPNDKDEPPYLYVELKDDPNVIGKKKYVRFKVNMRDI